MVGEDASPAREPGEPPTGRPPVARLISGGQTGVDRAALDAAIALHLPCGGWCPRDREAEDGPIDPRYGLAETESADPAERTRRNVMEADGTLIIAPARSMSGGTAFTFKEAEAMDRPCLVVDPASPVASPTIVQWLRRHSIAVLNVAGPRESESPGIYERVLALLTGTLSGDS
jgi:hypothetical protein